MNHSLRVTVLSSKLLLLAGWKIYEQASSEWVATYLSIRSRHSPLWFHSASNKIQTALQTKSCSSPPRCSCHEHSACRAWEGSDAILISPVLPAHVGSHRPSNFLFQISLSPRPGAHLLQKVPTSSWLGPVSAEQTKAPHRANWDSWAHSPHWAADSVQMTPLQN